MNKILLTALIIIAIAMIIISIVAGILPPGLTGMGFIIVAYFLANQKK